MEMSRDNDKKREKNLFIWESHITKTKKEA